MQNEWPFLVAADIDHDMAGRVDQIAHRQVPDGLQSCLPVIVGPESNGVAQQTADLLPGIPGNQDAEAPENFCHQAGTVPRVIGVTPAVSLAQKFETLTDDVFRRVIEKPALHVLRASDQRRVQGHLTGVPNRQLHGVTGERVLASHVGRHLNNLFIVSSGTLYPGIDQNNNNVKKDVGFGSSSAGKFSEGKSFCSQKLTNPLASKKKLSTNFLCEKCLLILSKISLISQIQKLIIKIRFSKSRIYTATQK